MDAVRELTLHLSETVTAAVIASPSSSQPPFKVMGELLVDLFEKLDVVHNPSSLFWLCRYDELPNYTHNEGITDPVKKAVGEHRLMTLPHVQAYLHVEEEPYLSKLTRQVILV
jgi:hypothetical protein